MNTDSCKFPPFSVHKELLKASFFSKEETVELMEEFEREYYRQVSMQVIDEIYEYTQGYGSRLNLM
jgi:hypothetical protein